MKRKYQSCSIIIVALMIAASLPLMALVTPDSPGGQQQNAEISSYSSHLPITIVDDADFAAKDIAEGWPGDGTQSNPYILQWFEIDASTANGIDIAATVTGYFIIRDCYIHGGGSGHDGIILRCPHGSLENNTCSNNKNGIYVQNYNGNIIYNNTCLNNTQRGIYLGSSSNNTLSNNTCSNNTMDGIYLGYVGSIGNTLINNTCSNNGDYGIYLYYYPSNNTLINNTCSNNDDSGIYLSSSSGNTISNNTCTGNAVYGIYLSSSSGNTISNNTCSNNTQRGIYFSSSSGNTLSNNTLSGNGCGIYLYYYSSGNTLSNNTCSNNTQRGIYIGSSSNNNILSNNTCSNNTMDGIYLGSSSDNTLSNNTCSNNTMDGIYLSSSTGNTLINNDCSGNAMAGLHLYYYSNNNVISNNSYSNNTQRGIYIGSSSGNILSNNTCSNNTVDGIYLGSASGNTLTDNIFSGNVNGIYLYTASSNIMADNICSGNSYGVYIYYYSSSNTLINNTCSNNTIDGIYLSSSTGNTLTENTCSNNTLDGICLSSSTGNTLTENTCSSNGCGIYLYYYANDNVISDNNCSNNSGYGMYLYASTSKNRIWNNTFYHNNGAGDNYNPSKIQAFDAGTSNRWNISGFGNWWSDWTTPDAASPWGIVDGPYSIYGGTGAKDYYPWVASMAIPICAVISPTSNPTYSTFASAIDLGGTASDDVGITGVTWLNAATGTSGTATGTTSWSIAGIVLNSGDNLITVRAWDGTGNNCTGNVLVIRDTSPPTVTITMPTSVATYSTNAVTINIGGTASDNIGVTSVTWVNAATAASGTASGTTSWSMTGIALSAGWNNITVTSLDAAGNTGTDKITVIRDNLPPTVTITSPANSPYIAISSSVALSGSAWDNIGVDRVTWANDRGGSGVATGNTSWSMTSIALYEGWNNITVRARDNSSNSGTNKIVVIYDATSPNVTITLPTSIPTHYTQLSIIDLGGTARDNTGVDTVTWTNDMGGSGTATGNTTWSITGIALSAGWNNITVTARDNSSNTGADTITLVYDAVSPICTIISPTSSLTYTTNASTIGLNGTASDNIGVIMVNWSNAATGLSGTANGTINWNVSGITLIAGSNLIYIDVIDPTGNIGTDIITVTYVPILKLTVAGTAFPVSGTIPLTVSFTCSPSGGELPYRYFWDFGDGRTSTERNPSHVYNSTGTFSATVTVTDNTSDIAQWSTTITVTSGGGEETSDGFGLLVMIAVIAGLIVIVIPAMLEMRKKTKEARLEDETKSEPQTEKEDELP